MSVAMAGIAADRPAVLVVDDEPILLMHALDIVEAGGFEAVEAASAAQAIAVLENRADIRIVFSDIDMSPGLDGMRLAALVRRRWPPVSVILTSGNHRASEVVLPVGGVFLPKPYRDRDVVEAMRRMTA